MRNSHILVGIGLGVLMTAATSQAADLASDWATLTSTIPADALALGKDATGHALYACRAMLDVNRNNLQVGKTSSAMAGRCDISYGGTEYHLADSQILMTNWANPAPNAVPLASTWNASTGSAWTYACRASYQGGQLLGWTIDGGFGCVVGNGGSAHNVKPYQILDTGYYVSTILGSGSVPVNAIQAGYDSDPGKSPLYLCIGTFSDGKGTSGTLVGKTRSGWNYCDIGWSNAEIKATPYYYVVPSMSSAPPGSVVWTAGTDDGGGSLGVCAASYASQTIVGKYMSAGACNIEYNGAEKSISSGYSVLTGSGSTILWNFPLIPQQQGNWCWAATAEMVASYAGVSINQCDIVNKSLNRTDCCTNEASCNESGPASMKSILNSLGLNAVDVIYRACTDACNCTAGPQPPFSLLQSEFAAGRGMATTYYMIGGGTHVVATTGAFVTLDSNGVSQQWVRVDNPDPQNVGSEYDLTYDSWIHDPVGGSCLVEYVYDIYKL